MRNTICLILLVFVISMNAIPNRDQFKPLSIELADESIAIITCRSLDLNQQCMKLHLIINTPTGYTNSIELEETTEEDIGIKLYAMSPIGSGVAVATYDAKNTLRLYVFNYNLATNTLSLDSIKFKATGEGINTLDVATYSSKMTANENKYYFIYSTDTMNTLYYQDFSGTFLSQRIMGIDDFDLTNLANINDNGGLVLYAVIKNCTNTTTISNYQYSLQGSSNNITILGRMSTNFGSLCPSKRSVTIKPVSSNLFLITSQAGCLGFANLYSPIQFKRDSPDSQENIKKSTRDSLSFLTFNYTSNNFRVNQIGFAANQTDLVISVLRCPFNDCSKTCYVEGHLSKLDLLSSSISRLTNVNGTFVDLPLIVAPNLGFDRIRFNGSYPLFRYNSLCFDSSFKY